MTKRKRRTFTDEFKTRMVQLYLNGKPRNELLKEYDLTAAAFDKWVARYQATDSYKEKDNKSDEQLELEKLRKERQHLKMENDILKQAALILGRK